MVAQANKTSNNTTNEIEKNDNSSTLHSTLIPLVKQIGPHAVQRHVLSVKFYAISVSSICYLCCKAASCQLFNKRIFYYENRIIDVSEDKEVLPPLNVGRSHAGYGPQIRTEFALIEICFHRVLLF